MTDKYLHIDAVSVQNAISDLSAQFPELVEDDDLRADMFEGETNLHEIVSRALDERQSAMEMVTGIKDRASNLSSRKARYERKADAMKSLIKRLMGAADLPKLELPEATISVTKGRVSVDVVDADQLPQGFYAIQRKPDSKAIKAAIEGGDDIPGAKLVTGDSGLTIRTK